MKKIIATILLALWAIPSSFAVLKEKNLEQTLRVLLMELETYNKEQEEMM